MDCQKEVNTMELFRREQYLSKIRGVYHDNMYYKHGGTKRWINSIITLFQTQKKDFYCG